MACTRGIFTGSQQFNNGIIIGTFNSYTSLCTVTAAVNIYYDPDPTSTIIEDDEVFVESFFLTKQPSRNFPSCVVTLSRA